MDCSRVRKADRERHAGRSAVPAHLRWIAEHPGRRWWTLPELQGLMTDAWFKDVHVLRESTRDSGRGDGCFRHVTRGCPDSNQVVYVAGQV